MKRVRSDGDWLTLRLLQEVQDVQEAVEEFIAHAHEEQHRLWGVGSVSMGAASSSPWCVCLTLLPERCSTAAEQGSQTDRWPCG